MSMLTLYMYRTVITQCMERKASMLTNNEL